MPLRGGATVVRVGARNERDASATRRTGRTATVPASQASSLQRSCVTSHAAPPSPPLAERDGQRRQYLRIAGEAELALDSYRYRNFMVDKYARCVYT